VQEAEVSRVCKQVFPVGLWIVRLVEAKEFFYSTAYGKSCLEQDSTTYMSLYTVAKWLCRLSNNQRYKV
jgi:hypothetical protein